MAGLVIVQIWPSFALASYFAKRLAAQYQEWTSVEYISDSWAVLASRTVWEIEEERRRLVIASVVEDAEAEVEEAEKAEIAMSAVEIIRASQTFRDIEDEYLF